MPRPSNKAELIELGDINLKKLVSFIDSLPEDLKTKAYNNDELNDRDKTISDIICHLHEWHNLVLRWYTIGMSCAKPKIPAEDVTWSTLPILNHRIYEQYRGTELKKAITMFLQSHEEIKKLISKHDDGELFTKKKYQWTGTTSLGAYFISATSSHYDWALKTLKPLKKLIGH